MEERQSTHCTAFEGSRCIASGELRDVVSETKAAVDRGERAPIFIFDDATGQPIEVDFRGTPGDVLRRLADAAGENGRTPADAGPDGHAPRGPGRPKLGVVAREVTLLPRHWEWLGSQPGGASVALRKLVDAARHARHDEDRVRRSQETAYRFMSAMAGDLPGFEEATRALFAGNREGFDVLTSPWPNDIRKHAKKLSSAAFEVTPAAGKEP